MSPPRGEQAVVSTWKPRWTWRRPADVAVGPLPLTDIVIAVALSAVPVAVAAGALHIGTTAPGVAACLGVIALTLPVAWRRRWPLAAAAVMAAGAVVNGLVFGHLIRCGVALPATFLVGFGIGARVSWPRAGAGLAVCAAGLVAEGFYDPQIGWTGLPFVLPLLLIFFVLGLLLRARNRTAEALRVKSAQLRRQREETARLAVLADRATLSASIETTLHTQLAVIADTAAAGLSPAADPAAAAEEATRALAAIEHGGREALGQLREVVGALQPPAGDGPGPAGPQPTLARLPELLSGLPSGRARLVIEGQPRPLPAGLELSGYRIVEHLVEALEDESLAVLEVRLRYHPEALELHVRGSLPAPTADLRAVLAAARERAVLHGGTVEGRVAGGGYSASARLPLVSGYA